MTVECDLHGILQVLESGRLDPAKLSADISRLGGHGLYLPDVETIVSQVSADAKSGDVLAVDSNGGFGGVHQKLLAAIAR